MSYCYECACTRTWTLLNNTCVSMLKPGGERDSLCALSALLEFCVCVLLCRNSGHELACALETLFYTPVFGSVNLKRSSHVSRILYLVDISCLCCICERGKLLPALFVFHQPTRVSPPTAYGHLWWATRCLGKCGGLVYQCCQDWDLVKRDQCSSECSRTLRWCRHKRAHWSDCCHARWQKEKKSILRSWGTVKR